MANFANRFRFISPLLIILLLSCSSHGTKIKRNEPQTIATEQAKELCAAGWKAQFQLDNKRKYKCSVLGWNDSGFITFHKGKIDTLEYQDISNVMEIESAAKRTMRGAVTGCVALSVYAGCLYLVAITGHPDDSEDDSNNESKMDLLTNGAIMSLVSMAIGGGIGSASHKYDIYYFNKDDFIANPWQADDSLLISKD